MMPNGCRSLLLGLVLGLGMFAQAQASTNCPGHFACKTNWTLRAEPLLAAHTTVNSKAGNNNWKKVEPSRPAETNFLGYVCGSNRLMCTVSATDRDDHLCQGVVTGQVFNYIPQQTNLTVTLTDSSGAALGTITLVSTQAADAVQRGWAKDWEIPESAEGRQVTLQFGGSITDKYCVVHRSSSDDSPDVNLAAYRAIMTVLKMGTQTLWDVKSPASRRQDGTDDDATPATGVLYVALSTAGVTQVALDQDWLPVDPAAGFKFRWEIEEKDKNGKWGKAKNWNATEGDFMTRPVSLTWTDPGKKKDPSREFRVRSWQDCNTNKKLDTEEHRRLLGIAVPDVEVTNIKFNHDTGSSASDAINIRQDYSTAYDISKGEWVKGVTNIPACYTTNKAVTIKARFTVQPASITSADIWAVSTDSGGSLGDVIKTNVTFAGGVSSPEYVTFQVSGNTPTTIKKTATDVWQWKMENVNGAGSAVCELNTSGVHTVYTIFNEPATPWVNTAGSQKNAWTKALEFAIVSAACNGDSTASNALSHIAQYLHAGHGLTYDTGDVMTGEAGRPKYASSHLGGTMDLTGYIDKSSTLYGTAGNVINCYDQASGVCTFGRLLGVSVTYRYMSRFGYINTVTLVGEGNCNNPFYPLTTGGKITGPDEVAPVRSRFGNHAFTSFGGYVFDACAGPHLGTRTEAQYVSDTVDSSTSAEAAVSGDTSNISSGAVTDLK